jgi:hypothetical protein
MPMDCFELQNRSSDFLDGTLIGSARRDADDHLAGCASCTEKQKHYRLLVTSLSKQSRVALPVSMRRSPLSGGFPRLEVARLGRSRWEQVPWYVRTTVEGATIVALILLGISTGPKIRNLYERNIEKNFAELSESLGHSDLGGSDSNSLPNQVPAMNRGKMAAAAASTTTTGDDFGDSEGSAASGSESESEEESDGEETTVSSGTSTGDGSEIRIGKAEVWRFNFKTDSPHEFRPKIVQVLSELKIPSNTQGLGGTEAPGGIQFDLMLPQAVVPSLMKQLQKLAPPIPEGMNGNLAVQTFTWYKNKSRQPIPSGMTHVVIWLSLL